MQSVSRKRKLTKVGGDSYGVSLPKDELRRRGWINDEGELVVDVEGEVVETEDGGLGVIVEDDE